MKTGSALILWAVVVLLCVSVTAAFAAGAAAKPKPKPKLAAVVKTLSFSGKVAYIDPKHESVKIKQDNKTLTLRVDTKAASASSLKAQIAKLKLRNEVSGTYSVRHAHNYIATLTVKMKPVVKAPITKPVTGKPTTGTRHTGTTHTTHTK